MRKMTRRDVIRLGLAGSVAQALLPPARARAAGGAKLTILFEGLCLYKTATKKGVEVVLMPAPDHEPFLDLRQMSLKTALSAFNTPPGSLFPPIPNGEFYSFSLDQVNLTVEDNGEIVGEGWPSLAYTRQCGCPDPYVGGGNPWRDLGWITHFDIPFPKNKGIDLGKINYFGIVTPARGTLEGASPSTKFRGLWTWEAFDSTQQGQSALKTGYIPGQPQALTNLVRYTADLGSSSSCTILLSQKNGSSSFPLKISNSGGDIALLVSYKAQHATTPSPSDRLLHYETFYDALKPLGLPRGLRPIPVLVSLDGCGGVIHSDLRESEMIFQKLIDGSIGCPGGTP
jgi:hypothetical protein